MRKTIRNPRFAGEFLERKLSPSGGLVLPPAEVLVLSATADAPGSDADEPRDPEPNIPYPPINGEPPHFPPLIPGGPMGPG